MKLTEHFTFEELTNSSSYPNLVAQNRVDANAKYLKNLKYIACTLEEIRSILNMPIKVTSGFRNTTLNTAVKGSNTSKHKEGLCADIVPTSLYSVKQAFDIILANRDKCPSLRKCIIEGINGKTWLHIQTKVDVSESTDFYTTNDGKTFNKVINS